MGILSALPDFCRESTNPPFFKEGFCFGVFAYFFICDALNRHGLQRTLAIRIAAITLASDSAITIARFRPSKTQTCTKLAAAPKLLVLKVPRTCRFENHRFWYPLGCQKTTRTCTKVAGAPKLLVLKVPRTCHFENHMSGGANYLPKFLPISFFRRVSCFIGVSGLLPPIRKILVYTGLGYPV